MGSKSGGAASIPRSAEKVTSHAFCRFPWGPQDMYECLCHQRMGNDFWFLPSDRCLFENDPIAQASPNRDPSATRAGSISQSPEQSGCSPSPSEDPVPEGPSPSTSVGPKPSTPSK